MNTLVFRLLGCVLAAVLLGSCTAPLPAETPSSRASSPTPTVAASSIPSKEAETMTIQLQVNGRTFAATLEQNDAARALAQRLADSPLTLRLQNYGGFEKVGPLGESLPANDRQTTTHAGDIVLYQGDQIVLFYGSNSWSYTRLGRVNDLAGWADALGRGDVTVTFSLAE